MRLPWIHNLPKDAPARSVKVIHDPQPSARGSVMLWSIGMLFHLGAFRPVSAENEPEKFGDLFGKKLPRHTPQLDGKN